MPRTRKAYPPEFRQRMIELVRSGRSPEELTKEFEPTANTIRNWVQQAERDEGLGLPRFSGQVNACVVSMLPAPVGVKGFRCA